MIGFDSIHLSKGSATGPFQSLGRIRTSPTGPHHTNINRAKNPRVTNGRTLCAQSLKAAAGARGAVLQLLCQLYASFPQELSGRAVSAPGQGHTIPGLRRVSRNVSIQQLIGTLGTRLTCSSELFTSGTCKLHASNASV